MIWFQMSLGFATLLGICVYLLFRDKVHEAFGVDAAPAVPGFTLLTIHGLEPVMVPDEDLLDIANYLAFVDSLPLGDEVEYA